MRAYGKIGGTCLQLNVISPETLRDAQRNPDTYRNLWVRVTGYNALRHLAKRFGTKSSPVSATPCSVP
ncbi:MAG: glycine radical domain-containing protein [Anaerolineae bacterium]